MLGKRTYKDLSQSDEVVPTNILAERLSRLLENGLIEKKAYQKRPVRYEYQPTPKGQDLWPVLAAITRWSNRYLPGTNVPPPGFLDSYKTDEGRAHLELGEPK